jgi:hypothetical protein
VTTDLCISLSGGKTSGMMTRLLVSAPWRAKFGRVVTTFMNTGEENEETLRFVHRMDTEWNLNVVWLEAVVNYGERRGNGHRVVTFETAARRGEPFEDTIKKYGIPNQAFPHCTRELKLNPLKSYLASIGWKKGDYVCAVGIRADEQRRVRKDAVAAGLIYPMVDLFPTTKEEVNDWWEDQPFNLGLLEHQGNCKWCWKKSLKKHLILISENRAQFDFPRRMEAEQGLAGYHFDDNKRVFFRHNRSTEQLFQIADAINVPTVRDYADEDSGCSESCEAFGADVEPELNGVI